MISPTHVYRLPSVFTIQSAWKRLGEQMITASIDWPANKESGDSLAPSAPLGNITRLATLVKDSH